MAKCSEYLTAKWRPTLFRFKFLISTWLLISATALVAADNFTDTDAAAALCKIGASDRRLPMAGCFTDATPVTPPTFSPAPIAGSPMFVVLPPAPRAFLAPTPWVHGPPLAWGCQPAAAEYPTPPVSYYSMARVPLTCSGHPATAAEYPTPSPVEVRVEVNLGNQDHDQGDKRAGSLRRRVVPRQAAGKNTTWPLGPKRIRNRKHQAKFRAQQDCQQEQQDCEASESGENSAENSTWMEDVVVIPDPEGAPAGWPYHHSSK